MNDARATLIIGGQRICGWLTDMHPDAPGEVVLVLDDDLSTAFWPEDLPQSHRIELLGPRERAGEIFREAARAGFNMDWPRAHRFPSPSQN